MINNMNYKQHMMQRVAFLLYCAGSRFTVCCPFLTNRELVLKLVTTGFFGPRCQQISTSLEPNHC